MYRDGGGFTAYVILEWATICHPRMYLSGIQYHRHSGMGLAGIQENVIPMSVSEEKSNVFSINYELSTMNCFLNIKH